MAGGRRKRLPLQLFDERRLRACHAIAVATLAASTLA